MINYEKWFTCKNKKDKKTNLLSYFRENRIENMLTLLHLINFQSNMFNNNCHFIIDSYIKLNFLNYILYFFSSFLKILNTTHH